ncbi:MAG: efflux RND transporter periplasmic adaptor subunit [Microscillaceae bacterium]|jgi:RND family efflux transporter MFP subunit|nr:efflux RND transporter periplasmic adaptor subunit [Microscillaceae bacterium]
MEAEVKSTQSNRKIFKTIRNWGIVALIIVSIGATLYANREKMKANAKLVQKSVGIFPVMIAQAQLAEVGGNFNATGNFEAHRELNFASETGGRVVSIFFDKGSMIGEGQTLLKIDDEALQRQLKIAQLNFDKRKRDLQRFENLASSNATTTIQVDEARFAFANAEQQIADLQEKIAKTTVKAPISGIINRKVVEKGSFLAPGAPIAEITDISSLKMIVRVAETEILKIKEGQKVKIQSEVHFGVDYQGIVKSVAVKADNSKRYEVEIALANNPQNPLKAGMFGTAYFEFNTSGKSLLIPRKAIVGSLRDAKIYVAQANQTAQLRNIKVGIVKGDKIEIIEGIKESENIIITGQINLQDGAKISVIK